MTPLLSLVILTRNEARNIAGCLRSVAHQTDKRFEVILIDAASTDGTLVRVRSMADQIGVPLRVIASDRLLPIGEARNMGVEMARADRVAFLSADAELEPKWIATALARLRTHDMVFGRQLHDPHAWTLGASVRGLRYHFPAGPAADPLVFASNVAAAYRTQVLLDFPFDPWANAAEDLLLATRAANAGYRAIYEPALVVRHHDVASWRQEMHKNVREGHGCAQYASELGTSRPWIAWGAMLGASLAAVLAASAHRHPAPRRAALAVLAGVFWLPAMRRAHRRLGTMPLAPLAAAVVASPAFDLAFLVQYLRGLVAARPPPMEVTT